MNKNTGEQKMKITVKENANWDGNNFQVIINGTKFPKERGVWYTPYGEFEEEKKAKAIEYAKAEYEGKYVARDGNIYNNREEYNKKFWEGWE
jgi:hypothetical protein